MSKFIKTVTRLIAITVFAFSIVASSASAKQIHIVIGDLANSENLNFLIAVERMRERGLDIKTSFLKSEEVAAQAVVSGQADIGMGTPYAIIQKLDGKIRMFYQLSTLRFFPIVNTQYYKTWKDLDGADIAVHARGSGTESIMMMMAQRNGIKYKSVSFVPGSGVRRGALMKGTLKASILNYSNKEKILKLFPEKFALLPLGKIYASDEALYANNKFMNENPDEINAIVEEMLKTWRMINIRPSHVLDMQKKYGLLKGIPKEDQDEILEYYEETVLNTGFPNNGGDYGSAVADFEFYAAGGSIKGDPKMLRPDDFWNFGPLNAAKKKLGMK